MKVKKCLSSFLMLGIILSFIPLAGCTKDDDVVMNFSYILGKWQGVSASGWEKEDGKVVDKWKDNELFDFDFIEFKAATGEWWDADSSRKHSFNWYVNEDDELVIGEKIVGDGTGEIYKIKTLTKDKLILVSGDDDPDDGWYQEDIYKRID